MIAILGDIHSNLSALTAVIKYCDSIGVTDYYSVGDIVGYYANPNECIDLLIKKNVIAVKGNHDAFVFEKDSLDQIKSSAEAVIEFTKTILKPDSIAFLKSLSYTTKINASIAFRLVHASLNQPFMWNYVKNLNEAINNISIQDTMVCFYGHTHIPLVFSSNSKLIGGPLNSLKIEDGTKYLINVGSVGQPRQKELVAHVVIFDVEDAQIHLKKIKYDPQITIENHKKANLPNELLGFLNN